MTTAMTACEYLDCQNNATDSVDRIPYCKKHAMQVRHAIEEVKEGLPDEYERYTQIRMH